MGGQLKVAVLGFRVEGFGVYSLGLQKGHAWAQ